MASVGTTERSAIDRFQGRYSFLSNFYPCVVRVSPADVLVDPDDRTVETYSSAEHAYQAAKTIDRTRRFSFRDPDAPLTAAQAKRLGRRVALRPDWEAVKLGVMLAVVRAKFSSPRLSAQLLETGDRRLIEGNTWGDVEWGVCEGRGQNKLGQILEIVRLEISDRCAEMAEEGAVER